MTLNWDFVTQVQSRSHNLGTPSQLLPLLIGLFQLVRIAWLAFHDHFLGVQEDSEQPVAHTEVMVVRKASRRFLVAWLPWLSQFSFWKVTGPLSVSDDGELGKQGHEKAVREYEASDLPQKEPDASSSPLRPLFAEKEVGS